MKDLFKGGKSLLTLIIMFALCFMFNLSSTAQVKKSPPKKSDTTIVDVKKSDSTFQVKGKFVYDTARSRFIMWADDGTELKPVVWMEGYIVSKYFVTPNQEPVNQDTKVYDLKWKILNKDDVWQAVKYQK